MKTFATFFVFSVLILTLGAYSLKIQDSSSSDEDKLKDLKKVHAAMTAIGALFTLCGIIYIIGKIRKQA